ncbi:Diguanylate cyclase, predicted domain protein [Rhodopirellula maiorica SM1]|uniref:diguanylate cyclase n=1 Tax=Rhodopirellula maiorica SM1 TaxID=1265738 RepID=M5RWZ6_9BACT|nr:GGDEF domain-containing protein [Rhodopirellula maiorica]EMI18474.1 Diguanylate cyclase, predicted domain protein [Rhodopirellula maiorica SM1]
MILDLAIAFSCAGVGVVCGWIMNGLGWGVDFDGQDDELTLVERSELEQVKAEYERLATAADRLREYATSMAMDVDKHQTSVQAVSDVLTSESTFSADALGDAVNRLIEANETMQTKLKSAQERISEQADQLESAERRAQTDALTRVSNRGAFDEHLARRHILGPGRAGTLMLLDVDHFKKFNDEHGHRAGDEVLKVVANMLHARLKSYGIVARFGGEEFAAIIDGYTVEESKRIVESARAAIGQHIVEFEGKELAVTASIGLAELLEDESIEQWIERADAAMYHSKKHGRNCGHSMNGTTPELITLGTESALIPDIDESPSVTVRPKKQTAKKPKPTSEEPNRGAFSSLPTRTALNAALGDMQERSKSIGLPMQIMKLHVTGTPAAGAMRTLLQIVRATLRSVDRIGADDATTLLICMPGIDDEDAQERVKQIHSSAASLQFGETTASDAPRLQIKIVPVDPDETLDEAFTRTASESTSSESDSPPPGSTTTASGQTGESQDDAGDRSPAKEPKNSPVAAMAPQAAAGEVTQSAVAD